MSQQTFCMSDDSRIGCLRGWSAHENGYRDLMRTVQPSVRRDEQETPENFRYTYYNLLLKRAIRISRGLEENLAFLELSARIWDHH
jgi:hypothetical protein